MAKAYQEKEIQFEGKYSREALVTLKMAYRPYRSQMIGWIVLGFIGRLLLLSNANIIGWWADSFCKAPAICRPIPSLAQGWGSHEYLPVLLFVTVFGFLLTTIFRIGFSRTSAQAVSLIYDEVTMRTSRFPMRFFDVTPVGRVVTRFSSDYGNVFRMFGGPMAEFLSIVFDLIAMVILVFFASPYFLPCFLLIAILNFVIYRLNLRVIREERRNLSRNRSPSIAHFAETTQGAMSVRIFDRQKSFIERFRFLNIEFLTQKMRTTFVLFRFTFQMNIVSSVLLLVSGFLGLILVQKGVMSIGAIGVAFTFVSLSSASLQMFFEWISQFEEAMTGVERLDHYLRQPLEAGAFLPERARFETGHPTHQDHVRNLEAQGKFTPQQAVSVKVDKVSFRYGSDLDWVLKDISFAIHPGERVGIVGRTGSGKSSLIQAILNLYPVEKGKIQVGDFSVGDFDLGLYRKQIAFISQDPVMFLGSIRENLVGDKKTDEQNILQALERVGLKSWVASLPGGLDFQIEEKGRNISVGERQLLCMARCLLSDAPVVIMDEATSSVDPQSEEILVHATEAFFKGRTQIIIAHRLTTLQHCDRVLWLDKGQVKIFGPREDVLRHFAQAEPKSVST